MAEEDRVTAVYDVGELTVSGTPDATIPPPAAGPGHHARLIVLEGVTPGRGWTLGPRTQLGRSTRVEVTVDDALASREHAVVSRDDAGWMIRDLGSRNGTHVNGRRVDVERLRYGDRISIGHTVLLFAHLDPAHEQLLERQKIEALGRLCAGIAHDLNNYFGAVLAAIDYVDGSPPGTPLTEPRVRECLDDVRIATQRGADLTRRLLSFARRGGEQNAPVDVSKLCVEAAELARRTFDRSIEIRTRVAPALTVRGDVGRLHQVLINLLVNARDAMPDGGAIEVTAEAIDAGDAPPGVRVIVADRGTGIDEATRARMFEPFFTTKAPEKGTGLGLAIVHDVVTSHGGTIACDSTVGKGTRFTIVLPSATAPRAGREMRTPHGLVPARRVVPRACTILVADDEAMVRRSIRRLLEREGHTVLEAGDGAAAVELVRAGSGIDLALLDLDMPALDGEHACAAIRQLRPALPVLILSGLCDEIRRQRLEALGARAVLSKPCDVATLTRAIASAMDAR